MSIEVKRRRVILDLAVMLDGFIEWQNGEVLVHNGLGHGIY